MWESVQMKQHIDIYHGDELVKYKCDTCGKVMGPCGTLWEQLGWHVRRNTRKRLHEVSQHQIHNMMMTLCT